MLAERSTIGAMCAPPPLALCGPAPSEAELRPTRDCARSAAARSPVRGRYAKHAEPKDAMLHVAVLVEADDDDEAGGRSAGKEEALPPADRPAAAAGAVGGAAAVEEVARRQRLLRARRRPGAA